MPILMQRDAVLQLAMAMVEHCAQCARPGERPGEWVLRLGDVRHDHQPGGDPKRGSMIGAAFLANLATAARLAHPEVVEVPEPPKMNVRPIDPQWIKNCDQAAKDAAAKLGTLVVLMVVQDGGKLGISTGGEESATGECIEYVKMLDEDPERFFMIMAQIVTMLKEQESRETRQ